jgi:hypothetical protein
VDLEKSKINRLRAAHRTRSIRSRRWHHIVDRCTIRRAHSRGVTQKVAKIDYFRAEAKNLHMIDQLFLPGKSNLLGSLEENVGMVAEVQEGSKGENQVVRLRIGVAQKPPVRLTKLAEISLSLTLDQAQELADVLRLFAVENKFPEESVRFEFKGDNLDEWAFVVRVR